MSYLTKLKLNGVYHDIRDAEAYKAINILNGDSSVAGSVANSIKTSLEQLKSTSYKVVEELPSVEEAEDGVIYLIAEEGTKSGTYTEYIKITNIKGESVLEKIGSTDMDLSDYLTREDSVTLAKNILIANGFEETNDLVKRDGYSYITLYKDGTVSTEIDKTSESNVVYIKENEAKQSELDELKTNFDNFKEKEQLDIANVNNRITKEIDTINQQTGLSSYVTMELLDGNIGVIAVNDVEVLQPKTTRIVSDTSWFSKEITEYTMSTPEEFKGMADLVSSGETLEGVTITLDSDLDFKGQELNPIGKITNNSIGTLGNLYKATNVGENVFRGTFDGAGHTISNYRITQKVGENSGSNCGVGLFGIVDGGATIENVNFSNVTIDSTAAMVGSVVGYIPRPTTGKVTTIKNVNITGNININGYVGVGAIAGRVEAGDNQVIIENCSVIGNNPDTSIITSSAKNGFAGVGGIVGVIYGDADNVIKNCVVKNITVTSSNEANGALVGHFERGTIEGNIISNVKVYDTMNTEVYMQEAAVVGAIVGTIDSTIKATSGSKRVKLVNNSISNVEVHIPASYTNTGNASGVKLDENGYPDWDVWPVIGSPRNVEFVDPTAYVDIDNLESLKSNIKIFKD